MKWSEPWNSNITGRGNQKFKDQIFKKRKRLKGILDSVEIRAFDHQKKLKLHRIYYLINQEV